MRRGINRGNGYPPTWERLLQHVPEGGRVLDCGSGDRRHPDERVISVEYVQSWPETVDVVADGAMLPFPDETFDLVLSQAVLEHVVSPQACVDEIRRVLKPGGVLYVEAAFMQPGHLLPWHYFNITPQGLQLLLSDWHVPEAGADGGLEYTLDWMVRKAGFELDDDVRAKMRALDEQMDRRFLGLIGSYVWAVAVKQ